MQQATHIREPEERGMVPEVWWDSGEVESDELSGKDLVGGCGMHGRWCMVETGRLCHFQIPT
jgi:hypothetical protein